MTGSSLGRTVDTSWLMLGGGTGSQGGARVIIHGKDSSETGNKGSVQINCYDGTNRYIAKFSPDGTATWGNKEIETIEEQGNGYIRYSNGLQICWGSVPVVIGTSLTYDPPSGMYFDRDYNFNYPKGFSSNPMVSLCVFTSTDHPFLQVCIESSANNTDNKLRTGSIMLSCKCATTIQQETSIHVQAIGYWK